VQLYEFVDEIAGPRGVGEFVDDDAFRATAPAPDPGLASVVTPTFQFEVMPAPVQGSMRRRS